MTSRHDSIVIPDPLPAAPTEQPATLLTLADIKTRLGITDTAQDGDLAAHGATVSALIRGYCGRPLSYMQHAATFYCVDRWQLELPEYPVYELSAVTKDGAALDVSTIQVHRGQGSIWQKAGVLSWIGAAVLKVEYAAGFITLPEDLAAVYSALVKRRLDAAGGDPATAVKGVTIFDAFKVEFQAPTQQEAAAAVYGSAGELSDFVAVLDRYRNSAEIIGFA